LDPLYGKLARLRNESSFAAAALESNQIFSNLVFGSAEEAKIIDVSHIPSATSEGSVDGGHETLSKEIRCYWPLRKAMAMT
jgi:hypothetical protein